VHVSLRTALSADPEAASVLSSIYKLAGRGTAAAELQLDLSDATFIGLQRKVESLALLKSQRSAHASELLQVRRAPGQMSRTPWRPACRCPWAPACLAPAIRWAPPTPGRLLAGARGGVGRAAAAASAACPGPHSCGPAALLQVLDSLWQALGIEEMADDRALFVQLMTGPYRLQSKSLEKVGAAGGVGRPANNQP
jgi:hypothetical protein